jgi:GrpB-like predicted nucleotidyltransferase (UPF0157 family)
MNKNPNLDEAVHLVPYDPAWPDVYDQERFRIALAFGVFPNSGLIQHIGSTAVPGLMSKPIIDIMLGVRDWPAPDKFIAGLAGLGYENLGEAGVPERLYLRRRADRQFNAHIVTRNGPHWTNNLALRDYLRADAAAREKYSTAKIAAVTRSGGQLLAYSEAKADVMAELIKAANAP